MQPVLGAVRSPAQDAVAQPAPELTRRAECVQSIVDCVVRPPRC